MNELEFRSLNDLTVNKEDENLIIEGVVNNIGEFSKIIGGTFREKINKGVFTRAIEKAKENSDIFFLHQHDAKALPLASVNSGTLELTEVEGVLKMRAVLPDTSFSRDIYTLVEAKVLNEFSFGFSNPKSTWEIGKDGVRERTIEDLDLSEISIVRIGAYNNTTAYARALEEAEKIINEDEETRALEEELKIKEYNCRLELLKKRVN